MIAPTSMRAAPFKSSYGPKYKFQPNLNGWNKTTLIRSTARSAAFGGAAGVAVLFYISGIPRVQQDILQKIPLVGRFFVKAEVDPQDNPF